MDTESDMSNALSIGADDGNEIANGMRKGKQMYKSPIDIIYQGFETQIEKGVLKAVAKHNIIVDKEELIRALEYDRGQYEKGYADAMASIVRCKDCENWREPWLVDQTLGVCCLGKKTLTEPNHFCSYGDRKTENM